MFYFEQNVMGPNRINKIPVESRNINQSLNIIEIIECVWDKTEVINRNILNLIKISGLIVNEINP